MLKKLKIRITITLFLMVSSPALAGDRYGTAADAQNIATALIQILNEGGLKAAYAAIHDPNGAFSNTEMGIHIFQNGVIMADSRDPELESVSYKGVKDLNGVDFWAGMVEAANSDKDFETKWYAYEDESEEYVYNCHSEWQKKDAYLVWICR